MNIMKNFIRAFFIRAYFTKVAILSISILLLLGSNHTFAAKIVLDAGHGGYNPGAIGVNGLYEKTVNFDVTLKLRDELERRGYTVSLTRETDHDLSLADRVAFKEAENADLFVSIHANAHRQASARGSLILYYDNRYPQARYPASAEMAALSDMNRQFARSVLDGLVAEAGTIDMGIVPSSVYVVRRGTMPSILVELAFLSNWQDAEMLADEQVRENMALGLANGIENFWPLGVFRDIAGHWASEAIKRMNEQGIVLGHGERYEPDRHLTRAEFLAMMDRVFAFSSAGSATGEESAGGAESANAVNIESVAIEESNENGENEESSEQVENIENGTDDEANESIHLIDTFSDIVFDHWAYTTLEHAVRQGFLYGYPDGSLRPDQPISRAEVSVLFDRIWSEDIAITTQPFDDVPSELWFATAVSKLHSIALVQGVSANLFAPDRPMSRAEMATLLDRFLELD